MAEKTGAQPNPTTAANQPGSSSRRQLLKWLGLGAAAIPGASVLAKDGEDLSDIILSAAAFVNDKVEISLHRPQDLLELELVFTGYQKATDGKSLTRTASPNLLIVTFPPQSITEQAFLESGGNEGGANFDSQAGAALKDKPSLPNNEPVYPAKTYLSGTSRLVFEIPASVTNIPLTAKALLDWDRYKLVVNKRAQVNQLFTIEDAKVPDYNKPLGNNPNLSLPKNIEIKTSENNNNNQRQNPQPNNNLPVRIIRNGQPDTLQRRVNVNRELRGATKDEEKAIVRREAPRDVAANPVAITPALVNLTMGKTPRPVAETETCIEMPFRLYISPNQTAAWYHEHELKLREDLKGQVLQTYELWHTRMTCKNCDGLKDLTAATQPVKTIRALWAEDDVDKDGKALTWDNKPLRDDSFVTALYNDDRHCIVHQTSNFSIDGFRPKAVDVNNLMLSGMGAWLDAEVRFTTKELQPVLSDLNLLKWKHIATLARDHYVEVVYAGNMLPFGHEAALVRITERKPQKGYAVNRQRYFIVINEAVKKYNTHNTENGNFKSFPFSTIKFVTTITPTLDAPLQKFCDDITSTGDQQFIPRSGGKPFQFKLIGYDLDGGEVSFQMPLAFISTNITYQGDSYNLVNAGRLNNCYNKNTGINTVSFRNQKMALTRSETKGDTEFEISSIQFYGISTAHDAPGFRPRAEKLDIYIPAVENMVGKREAVTIRLVDDEINKPEAQRKNKGKVFAELVNKPAVNFNGSGNKTGGSLSPNFTITGLSKSLGAVGGNLAQLQNMQFDPLSFFDDSAKLFGVIPLKNIIQGVSNAAALVSGESVQSPIPALKNIETKDAFITQYVWKGGTLKTHTIGICSFVPDKKDAAIKVETNLYRYKDSSKSNALVVDSYLENFAVTLVDIAAVNFKKVGFKTGSNAKVDFTVDMKEQPLQFLGPLSFINDLQKYIPADGFSDPPFLDVTSSGVTTGYTLALPDIQLGAFTLRNINLGATVKLPFTGDPMSIRFNFCEKQQPFTLTVSALGGGGFFAIEFDMNGLRALEAALEFGAAASINLGVASGAVSIMAGIYFKYEVSAGGNNYKIEGYVRINGALSVLGLITASVEFLLTLGPVFGAGNKVVALRGTAQLKIKIEVFMFSKTVTLTTSREFAGAGADPTFGMMMSENDWVTYCDTFAA